MARFHINPTTGAPGICRAAKGGCPFGNDDAHFTSRDAAISYSEKQLANEHGLVKKHAKSGLSDYDSTLTTSENLEQAQENLRNLSSSESTHTLSGIENQVREKHQRRKYYLNGDMEITALKSIGIGGRKKAWQVKLKSPEGDEQTILLPMRVRVPMRGENTPYGEKIKEENARKAAEWKAGAAARQAEWEAGAPERERKRLAELEWMKFQSSPPPVPREGMHAYDLRVKKTTLLSKKIGPTDYNERINEIKYNKGSNEDKEAQVKALREEYVTRLASDIIEDDRRAERAIANITFKSFVNNAIGKPTDEDIAHREHLRTLNNKRKASFLKWSRALFSSPIFSEIR